MCNNWVKQGTTNNMIFSIYFLQLFDNILCAIWTSIIHYNYFEINIPESGRKTYYKSLLITFT